MSKSDFHSGLSALLQADTALSAWSVTHFGQALSVINGVRVETIRPGELPALVLELGDASTGPEVLNHSQRVEDEIHGAIVWHEQDYDDAFTQRLTLPDILIKAVMADPGLDGKVDGAWVSRIEPDRNVNHPEHLMWFTVKGTYSVYNT